MKLEKDEVVTTNAPITDKSSKTKSCKIISTGLKFIGVDFEGYGIKVDVPYDNEYKVGRSVDIKYSGEIGKPNFKFSLA